MDTGGTFTDCIAVDPKGTIHRLKLLSSSVLRGQVIGQPDRRTVSVSISWPVSRDIFSGFQFRAAGQRKGVKVVRADLSSNLVVLASNLPHLVPGTFFELSTGEEVPVLAARLLTATKLGKPFPPMNIRLGSTRGTNAMLERKGARTVLLVTRGFRDLLIIGNQQRPDLFTLEVRKVEPLCKWVEEIDERVAADGSVLTALDSDSIRKLAAKLRRKRVQSVAIAFLNAFANPIHEKQVASVLRREGFRYVSVSHELSSQIRLLTRAETTVANAYLEPIIRAYLSGIQKGLTSSQLSMMTSSGSLVKTDVYFPKDSLLSGPAGGVVGAAHQALKSGEKRILAFDMGGTSTDVSMYNGRFDYRFESRVGPFSILAPSLAIETIAAGGGSICDFDGHRLTVGPASAGANPGPACYGAGGPLTLTDVNLLLGRIDPSGFAIPLKPADAKRALDNLVIRMAKTTGRQPSSKVLLESFRQIANEKMAEAIRKISVQQGHDPREFTLLSFGGAGGQHACALADMLGMRRVLIPSDAGLLSAYGISRASVERFEERLILRPWDEVRESLDTQLNELFEEARRKVTREGYAEKEVRQRGSLLFLRFTGQDTSIELDYRRGDSVIDAFRKKYEQIYGHWTDRVVEVESIRVIAEVKAAPAAVGVVGKKKTSLPHVPKPLNSGMRANNDTPVYQWEFLKPGAKIEGPALVVSSNSTTRVDPGWALTLEGWGNAILVRQAQGRKSKDARRSKEGSLELFTNRFTAIAHEMGALLQRTSFSVNIKERLDFSCALMDAGGNLVVNAPHIPVHLGSMGVCVREVRKHIPMRKGDVVITNHPAFGGSHLPDVTLIKPVFFGRTLVGYVANRAHHAEIGGSKPGSMPADARRLDEEGVILSPSYLVERGKPQWDSLIQLLTGARFPTRSLQENLADLNGALASVNLGEAALVTLCEKYTVRDVVHHMKALRNHASALLEERLKTATTKAMSAIEYLDDGSALSVKLLKRGKKLVIDFSGSAPMHAGNLNATPAIVQSVVLYILRLWINHPLPMNEGLMERVVLRLPPGLLNPDFSRMPAVVGGNTEVSQRLTDTLLKALGLASCSQGTMNNFLFGNDRFGYYETICGGTGAGNGFTGTDAVHQHMTNTRITDPEVLEFRYPVRLLRFEVRAGSGGKGKWRGGNGVVREVQFLETLDVNLLTQHRVQKPYGLAGGKEGMPGKHILHRASGLVTALPGIASFRVDPGDRLVIETPGGGGYGTPKHKKTG
jgi:5-oxoprolinase (ATP-hydrolysing)